MDHACRYWQCPENYGGQCFGGGCKLNPMPAPIEPLAEDGDENENTRKDDDGEK